jgi:hypothetical protein
MNAREWYFIINFSTAGKYTNALLRRVLKSSSGLARRAHHQFSEFVAEVFFRLATVDSQPLAHQNVAMRRAATTGYCIVSLLVWLNYAPYLHAHSAEEGGEVHSHFESETEPGHESHSDEAELHHPEDGHHAVDLSAFCGYIAPLVLEFSADAGETFALFDRPVLEGKIVEQPVRVHDPPARRFSSPRPPPA